MKRLIEYISRFLKETIWKERRNARRAVRFFTRMVQVSFLVAKGFFDDKCFLRASALAYVTLLTTVHKSTMMPTATSDFKLVSAT